MNNKEQMRIMNNVDRLLRKQDIKRSTIEDDFGISHGYLARLIKADKPSYNLSYEMVKKFADYFHVSMDYLMLNSSDHTTDENSLIDFFESIFTMSAADSIFWMTFTTQRMDGIDDPFYEFGPITTIIERSQPEELNFFPTHIAKEVDKHLYEEIKDPNFRWVVNWTGKLSLGKEKTIGDIVYSQVQITGDYFYTSIEKINSTLYLYQVEYADDTKDHKLSNVIEAYLLSGKEKHYLCNSIERGVFISSKLKDLYQIAKDSCSGTRLDESTRKLLSQFNAN